MTCTLMLALVSLRRLAEVAMWVVDALILSALGLTNALAVRPAFLVCHAASYAISVNAALQHSSSAVCHAMD